MHGLDGHRRRAGRILLFVVCYLAIACPALLISAQECATLLNCSAATASAGSCGWCPSLNKALAGDVNGPSNNVSCPATLSQGQWTYLPEDCAALTATSCSAIGGHDHWGWCPTAVSSGGVMHGRVLLGDEDGPWNNLPCPASEKWGTWVFYSDSCNCNSFTSCDQIANSHCGWCPTLMNANNLSMGHAYIGTQSGGPSFGITCPSSLSLGQWTYLSADCACLTTTDCNAIGGHSYWGWCPTAVTNSDGTVQGRCLLGGSSGPNDLVCAANETYGQWTIASSDCKCLTCDSCTTIGGTDCGYCGANKRCYIGNDDGPFDGLTCTDGWQYSSGSCPRTCPRGFWGPACDYTCDSACSDGLCDINSGACTACPYGYWGSSCSRACLEFCAAGASCRVDNGKCQPNSSNNHVVTYVWVTIVVVGTLIFFAILIIRKRRREQRRREALAAFQPLAGEIGQQQYQPYQPAPYGQSPYGQAPYQHAQPPAGGYQTVCQGAYASPPPPPPAYASAPPHE